MAEPIVLNEYETRPVTLTDRQAKRLATAGAATGALLVTPDTGDERWLIKAAQMVGTLAVDGVEVRIRPKVPLDNLFLMLEVGLPNDAWQPSSVSYGTADNLLPAVVAFFARTVEAALARGVFRTYREQREPLIAFRGRLDVPAQLGRAGVLSPVACRFDELTADVFENRYLKAAVRRALRVPAVQVEHRQLLRRQLLSLDTVLDVALRPETLDQLTETRLNAHYLPALRLARLILERSTLVDVVGATPASAFLLDMNLLFERFVTERLRRLLFGRLRVVPQTDRYLAEGSRVKMRPDLEFHHGGRAVYVADCKYKLLKGEEARTADYYQLLAYTTALDLPEGVLIYCDPDGDTPDSVVTVRHAGKKLRTYPLNLAGSPADVAIQIANLATQISSCAAPIRGFAT